MRNCLDFSSHLCSPIISPRPRRAFDENCCDFLFLISAAVNINFRWCKKESSMGATSELISSPLAASVRMTECSCFKSETSPRDRGEKNPREDSEASRWWWWWEEQWKYSPFCQSDLRVQCHQLGRANPGVVRTVSHILKLYKKW